MYCLFGLCLASMVVDIVMGGTKRDDIIRVVEIYFFTMLGGSGFWSSLLRGCSGLDD